MADLLASTLATDWFEAVSLVRELCAVLISERVEDSMPDLGQILLVATGRITITGTTSHGDAPVRRLGQLLQALLRSTEPPVTLRLVLSEAMAVPPVYASVTELDAALAYFERPDRYVVLKALFDRASKAEIAATVVTSVQDLDLIAPVPRPETTAPKKQRKPANRRATTFVVVAAAVVAVAAFAVQRGTVNIFGVRAATAVDKAVLTTVSAASELAGMGKLVDEPVATVEVPPLPPSPVPSSSRRATAHAFPVTLAGVPVKLFDLQPAREVDVALASPASVSPDVLEASAEPNHGVDTKLYGPEDRSVAAPVMMRPHLPTALPIGVDTDQLARIELVVAPDGIVESVKLVPGKAPVMVTEAMLLSAAKAWRFSPATKGGEAVRYRKTVFLSDRE